MIILNALFPIFSLLFLGGLLRRLGLTDSHFLKTSDRLVYYIFFPLMLFWKIGSAPLGAGSQWLFIGATIVAVVVMFLISVLIIKALPVGPFQAGSFSQSCYRFNTYIGVAVILNSLGAEGIAYYGVLIALVIPLINVFAVSLLIWYSGVDAGGPEKTRIVTRAIVANPLIVGCFLGIVYARLGGEFPAFIDNSLQLMSMVTLPLALMSIGGGLSFTGVYRHLPLSLLAAVCKLGILPLVGYLVYRLFQIDGVPFQTGMIFFCLPTSTAIYVLSSQLNSDTELASAAIVVSTLLSFGALSVALLL
ncbi:MAG: AEC family transporter [Desulfofustis sp.]|nr:AEC family transporter [Desulfofustis sp.]